MLMETKEYSMIVNDLSSWGTINYGQDFSFFRGKLNIKYAMVELFGNDLVQIRAIGYGIKEYYGNGAIYVRKCFVPNNILAQLESRRDENEQEQIELLLAMYLLDQKLHKYLIK